MDTIRNTIAHSVSSPYHGWIVAVLPTMTRSFLARVFALSLVISIAPLYAQAQERCFRNENGRLKCCDQNGNCYYPQQR